MNVVVTIIFAVLAIALIIIGGLSTAGKLPGNSVIGLRVADARKSKEVWDRAHRIAGPFTILSGVALAFGAAFSYIAVGWMWIAPIVAAVIAVLALSAAGNMGARAALVFAEAQESAASSNAVPTPQVDLNALRNAASKADGNDS